MAPIKGRTFRGRTSGGWSLLVLFTATWLLVVASPVFAAEVNVITPIFPIRGREYWRQSKDISELDQITNLLDHYQLPATYLIHYDVLQDEQILDRLKSLPANTEIGLFLEVTRRLAEDSFVLFDWATGHWSAADKLFLSGYTLPERRSIIDRAFTSFKDTFGYYPKSYGAWYVDVFSLQYIKEKYGADINLGLADQYATDGYQTWGQYLNQPYYISRFSAIEPATGPKDSTQVLKVLWAPREPSLSFSLKSGDSNHSLQVNDYHRALGFSTDFAKKLLDQSTVNVEGKLAQLVVGIEISEIEPQYFPELKRLLAHIAGSPQLTPLTLNQFNQLYRQKYQFASPAYFISSSPRPEITSYWYFSPRYRLGLFLENNRLVIKDQRFYQQNPYLDNDQTQPDTRANLHRLVPAQIDAVVLGNPIDLGEATDLTVTQSDDVITLSWADNQLLLEPNLMTFKGLVRQKLPSSLSHLYLDSTTAYLNPWRQVILPQRFCIGEAGGFASPFSCVKKLIYQLSQLIPDLRYSRLDDQHYLGLPRGSEELIGVRFPRLKIGPFHFEFPILANFLSLKNKLTPQFSWYARQEDEVSRFRSSYQVIEKTGAYGQEEIMGARPKPDLPAGRQVFENGSYYVLEK